MDMRVSVCCDGNAAELETAGCMLYLGNNCCRINACAWEIEKYILYGKQLRKMMISVSKH